MTTSEQGRPAAVATGSSDRPRVRRRSGIDAALCPGRHGRSRARRSVCGELKRTGIRESVVDLTVDLGNDFYRKLRPGFEIVFQRPDP